MQKAYSSDRYQAGAFPVTEKLCATVLALPMHPELTQEQLDYIVAGVLSF